MLQKKNEKVIQDAFNAWEEGDRTYNVSFEEYMGGLIKRYNTETNKTEKKKLENYILKLLSSEQ